ncbi:MAG: NFACT family protein [Oscillospiraceae bacterium]|jgi:predicted ribosome quality control (RQC) complex YloA/Tae2 family protein|nr:NFACT family protein [Oscillospiraceae bacterium]
MPLDACFLTVLTDELNRLCAGGRVDKIHQPSDGEVVLSLRGSSGSHRLLVSIAGQTPRIHVTAIARENPARPPMFTMLLRKHLQNARLRVIEQEPNERVARLCFDAADEMGTPCEKRLIAELMGRNSNLILTDGEGRILDSLRRTDIQSPHPVAPGMFYRLPASRPTPSPVITREMEHCAQGDVHALLRARSGEFAPYVLTDGGVARDFYFMPLRQYDGAYKAERFQGTYSELLDTLCTQKEIQAKLAQKLSGVRKRAVGALERVRRKMHAQQAELAAALDRERLRQYGDLLMACPRPETRGLSEITVEDYYGNEGDTAAIPLNVTLSLSQNAAAYYKTYRKMKTAEAQLARQLETARSEVLYWESVLDELSRVTSEKELDEIREELNPKPENPKAKRQKPLPPETHIASDGTIIRVGRNNRQNDELTLRLAAKNDLWFHAKNIPGSHVVASASGGKVSESALLEAARLAAVNSKARHSRKVEVDYTSVKHVKKPPGAKPGMVLYTNFKTILADVTPRE